MPLYEYECDACGHRFESIQKFSDAPVERCPKCGGAVHKLQSAPAFHLKGTGWYITDYAKKDQPAGGKTESGAGDAKNTSKDTAASDKTETAASTDKAAKAEKKTDTKSLKAEGSSLKKSSGSEP
jgi:putative FmdB family regulatory protein